MTNPTADHCPKLIDQDRYGGVPPKCLSRCTFTLMVLILIVTEFVGQIQKCPKLFVSYVKLRNTSLVMVPLLTFNYQSKDLVHGLPDLLTKTILLMPREVIQLHVGEENQLATFVQDCCAWAIFLHQIYLNRNKRAGGRFHPPGSRRSRASNGHAIA